MSFTKRNLRFGHNISFTPAFFQSRMADSIPAQHRVYHDNHCGGRGPNTNVFQFIHYRW